MRGWQKAIRLSLAACVLSLPCGECAFALHGKALPDSTRTKDQVLQFGIGAQVKVKLAEGKTLRGSIAGIEDGAFLLASDREASSRRVGFDEVVQIKLAKVTYRVRGRPDPIEARRVVRGLGVAKHIMVKTTAGQNLRGHIQKIGEDHFTLLPDRTATPTEVFYNDVQQVGPNLSKAQKIAIAVVVVAAVVAVVLIVATVRGVNELDFSAP